MQVQIAAGGPGRKTLEHMNHIKQYLLVHNGAKTKDIAEAISLSPARKRAILKDMKNVRATGEYGSRKYWLDE